MPRTSIIVTDGPGVAGALASAFDQTDPDFEVVLVTAPGREPGAAFAGEPRLRLVRTAATGFADRVNEALVGGCSDFVKLLPADQRLAPTCLEVQAAALEARAELGVVFVRVERVDEAGRPLSDGAPPDSADDECETPARSRDELLPALLGSLSIPAASALLRREALVAARGLDAVYTRAATHDLWLRVLGGHDALLLHERLVRVPVRERDVVAEEERGLAQLRALTHLGTERFLDCLGGGRDRAPVRRAGALLALGDTLLASRQAALLPAVRQLFAEAGRLGARLGAARAARLEEASLGGLLDPGVRRTKARAPRAEPRTRDDPAGPPTEPALGLGALWWRLGEVLGRYEPERATSDAPAEGAVLATSEREVAPGGGTPVTRSAGAIAELGGRIARSAGRLLEGLRLGSRLRRATGSAARGSRADGSADGRRPGGRRA